MKYESYTIHEAVEKLSTYEFVLQSSQRRFVWKMVALEICLIQFLTEPIGLGIRYQTTENNDYAYRKVENIRNYRNYIHSLVENNNADFQPTKTNAESFIKDLAAILEVINFTR